MSKKIPCEKRKPLAASEARRGKTASLHISSDTQHNPELLAANSHLKVIAAIPCFNAELFIGDVVSKARKYVDQVIVIDDGSTDGTAQVARTAGVVVVSQKRNVGKGSAMKIAAEAASNADVIVFLDGDGRHAPEDIPEILVPILQNKADLVLGSRCLSGANVAAAPFTRKFINNIASFVISVIIFFLLPMRVFINQFIHRMRGTQQTQSAQRSTKYWITDCTSGFRAIKVEAWQRLNLTSQRFEIETEMIYEAAINKLTIAEVPISCIWDTETSSLSVIADGLATLGLLLRKLFGEFRERQSRNVGN